MEQAILHPPEPGKPIRVAYLWRMIRHPLQEGQEIAAWGTIWPGLLVVLALGLYMTVGCYRSHLNGDYPPPAEELRVWIATWGEFAMLPVLDIPLERYRLFMAQTALPGMLASWLGMAGLARLLTGWFGAQTTFRQYLNLLAFSFFPFWFLAILGDGLYSAGLGDHVLPGLRGEYGTLAQAFFTNYPPLLYTVLFGCGAVYNGLAAYAAASPGKKLRGWQAGLIGWLTFVPPILLASFLYR